MFVVRSAKLDFLQPAHLGDALEVSVEVRRRRPASVTLRQQVALAEKVLCAGEILAACGAGLGRPLLYRHLFRKGKTP